MSGFLLRFKAFTKIYILREKENIYLNKWYLDNGEEKLRYDYPLGESSIVFDVGGYLGEFAEKISEKYNSTVYFFEPVDEFFDSVESKLKGNENIRFYKFGLGAETRTDLITFDGAASSAVKKSDNSKEIKIVNVIDFMNENRIDKVDLIKINIEGMEYELLNKIISEGKIKCFENIQVQFHNFEEGDSAKRDAIREKLAKTHYTTYEYPFVWENWKLK